ncbi:serine hydrolase [Rhabdothermincola sediminis]|uniref:serine hydrolase n=1 Tax=Rhabdothermincola sediminis TaxID=2751370 RepID=UPI001AA09763|nr:serine hydrolase [Rhabdothermincola sediminis]
MPPDAADTVHQEGPGLTPSGRDGFLDLIRAVATLRVIVWHAFGAAVITYVIAAMPAMFFVTGSLFARSADRHGARTTIADRLRRIAPSLWVFAAVAWTAMWVGASRSGTGLDWRHVVLWIVPISDPAGSPWEGGWLATPLWYLRTLLWIFLLAPLAIRAVRRWPVRTFAVSGLAVVALDLADRAGWLRPAFADRLVWQLGDLALYGTFFLFGVRVADGSFDRVRPRNWALVASVATIGAVAWWLTQPVPSGVVNNSHPMHLLVGTVWLALALASVPALRRLADHHLARPVVRFLGQRSLTVYLWHTSAIVVALWILDHQGRSPRLGWGLSYVVLIAGGVVVACVLFGWIEDLGAKRPPKLWPLPTAPARRRHAPVAVASALLVTVLTVWVVMPRAGDPTSEERSFRPGVPSQAPPKPTFDPVDARYEMVAGESGTARAPVALGQALDEDGVHQLVAVWALEHGVPGVAVGLAFPDGPAWVTALGVDEEGRARDAADRIDVMSITKLFTANLVFRAAEAGLLELDEPLPGLGAYPALPRPITVRELLTHRSGLLNYWESEQYVADPESLTSPLDALAIAAASPLQFEPGSESRYSSTNYIVLGVLLEQVTGQPFDVLVDEQLLRPLGLESAAILPPQAGLPRTGAAGIVTDLADLGRGVLALLRDHVGISDASYRAMTDIDRDSAMGAGVNGFCPCRTDPDGGAHWFGMGYAGGHTLALYLPTSDVVVTVDVTGSFWEDDRFAQVMELVERIDAHLWQHSQEFDGEHAPL